MPSKKLHEIVFPVYKLPNFRSIETNPLGLVIMETEYTKWVLDDTNMDDEFFHRRWNLKELGRRVYPLRKRVPNLSYLIKYSSNVSFIDFTGYIFKYNKGSKYWDLTYHKIESQKLVERGIGVIITCRGINIPFYFSSPINIQQKYLGLINKNGMYIPYGFSKSFIKKTRRKI